MLSLIPKDASKIGTVVGIDPGSSNLGFGCIEIDVESIDIQRTYSVTISPEKYLTSSLESETHGDRYARIYKLSEIIYKKLMEIAPIAVVCESPFIHRMRPMAYGALVEVVYAVRLAVHKYNPTSPLYLIDPPRAKKAVGATSAAKKEGVLEAVIAKSEELKFDAEESGKELKDLDEHSSDAIAIAYSMINDFRGETCLFS